MKNKVNELVIFALLIIGATLGWFGQWYWVGVVLLTIAVIQHIMIVKLQRKVDEVIDDNKVRRY